MTTFHPPRPGERMLPVEEAQERVLAEVRVLDAELVSLEDALGRALREDVAAPHDVPEGDNTAMDGYAVRADDVANAPVTLRVIEDLPAGAIAHKRVEPGTAIRIMTGALMPEGADAVVQVELTDAGSEMVLVKSGVTKGSNIRRRGEDMRAGDAIMSAGTPLRAAEIGVLAGAQRTRVRVGRRPTVAILSTGDELVDIDQPRGPGKVVNSNAWSLESLVIETGAVPRRFPVVRDTREETIAAIQKASDCDFILSSGGVSAGAYDFVKEALDALGAETHFWQVAMKPGKPVVLSKLRGRIYFGLPGNPVSCMVAFHLFVAPSLKKAMGQTANVLPPMVRMPLAAPMKAKGDRRAYQRVRIVAEHGQLRAHPMTAQGSGVSTSMLGANGLAVMEKDVTRVEAGEAIDVVVIGPILSAPV